MRKASKAQTTCWKQQKIRTSAPTARAQSHLSTRSQAAKNGQLWRITEEYWSAHYGDERPQPATEPKDNWQFRHLNQSLKAAQPPKRIFKLFFSFFWGGCRWSRCSPAVSGPTFSAASQHEELLFPGNRNESGDKEITIIKSNVRFDKTSSFLLLMLGVCPHTSKRSRAFLRPLQIILPWSLHVAQEVLSHTDRFESVGLD